MASTPSNAAAAAEPSPTAEGTLLVSLAPLSPESVESALTNLALAFPSHAVLVATPDIAPNLTAVPSFNTLRLLPYAPPAPSASASTLTAADFLNAYKLAHENNATACL